MAAKMIGGVMLVVGTTIGAGMLALPVATAELGFLGSLTLLILGWGIMTICALLFLEVNLSLPPHSNLISMAGATLGMPGQIIAWIFYLMLLYSILSAYIAGGGDILHFIFQAQGINVPFYIAAFIFTFIFGFVVALGIKSVDYINRGLMIGKLGAFLILALLIMPFVSLDKLTQGELFSSRLPTSLSVTAVSFACLLIIPSLRTYYQGDVKALRRTIFIGTLIPLICYILWDMVIMGVIPIKGTPSLSAISHSKSSTSDLVSALTTLLNKDSITVLAKFFTSICMATSFLSVALSLSDFLADGLRVRKHGMGNIVIITLTFLPPIVIVLFHPGAFITGLQYAGLSVFVLMVFLPPLMAWRGRYHIDIQQTKYRVRGGKFLLAVLVIISILMIGFSVSNSM